MDLFEYLMECVGCDYISDLKYGAYKNIAIQILIEMDKTHIDSEQIADALSYFGVVLV